MNSFDFFIFQFLLTCQLLLQWTILIGYIFLGSCHLQLSRNSVPLNFSHKNVHPETSNVIIKTEFQWKSPCQEPTIGWLLSQVVPAWSRIRPEFCSWSVFWWGKTCFHFLTIRFAENQNGTHRGFNSTFHSVDEWVTLECRRPTLFRAQCAVTQSNIERKYEQARVYYI